MDPNNPNYGYPPFQYATSATYPQHFYQSQPTNQPPMTITQGQNQGQQQPQSQQIPAQPTQPQSGFGQPYYQAFQQQPQPSYQNNYSHVKRPVSSAPYATTQQPQQQQQSQPSFSGNRYAAEFNQNAKAVTPLVQVQGKPAYRQEKVNYLSPKQSTTALPLLQEQIIERPKKKTKGYGFPTLGMGEKSQVLGVSSNVNGVSIEDLSESVSLENDTAVVAVVKDELLLNHKQTIDQLDKLNKKNYGTDPEYLEQISILKVERDAFIECARLFKQHQIEIAHTLYNTELEQCDEEYQDGLRARIQATLDERRKKILADRDTSEISGEEKAQTATRSKLNRVVNVKADEKKERKRKVNHLVGLKESEIYDDMDIIRKLSFTQTARTSKPVKR